MQTSVLKSEGLFSSISLHDFFAPELLPERRRNISRIAEVFFTGTTHIKTPIFSTLDKKRTLLEGCENIKKIDDRERICKYVIFAQPKKNMSL